MPGLRELSGKVAVVTGGGSGIGGGLCRRFAHNEMSVIVSDIDLPSAERTAADLRDDGAQAVAVACDVSNLSEVETLASATLDAFGRVDVVCNNAGIFLGGNIREFTEGDWNWTLAVNVMGVVHGSTVFTPYLAQQGSGHIVNTASIGGFSSDPNCAPYTTSKYAVVGYSEALRRDLAADNIGVSMLCPGPVATGIDRCDRLRPASAGESKATSKAAVPIMEIGMHPDEVGDLVVRGIGDDAPYIFTHPELGALFEARFAAIRDGLEYAPTPRDGAMDPSALA
ncbi:MAG: SDR family NAD(P)-dependent oxidoreductase [Myxococcota bacterium]|nr:SDR family NAD(P)-dependent oxidoreductase [Myxococcota bacterium]